MANKFDDLSSEGKLRLIHQLLTLQQKMRDTLSTASDWLQCTDSDNISIDTTQGCRRAFLLLNGECVIQTLRKRIKQ